MPARKPKPQLSLLEARSSTAPCVPSIREAVEHWRKGGYKGTTDTTRLLLKHWFHTAHGGLHRGFRYHQSQQEAIETLVYLYEVARTRSLADLLRQFVPGAGAEMRLLQHDDFARYCVKMATGSGKTKVMSLAIAWHYFNAVAESRDDFARTFLLVAPNVIVFERLQSDFAGGRIFRSDPVIPPELEIFWDFQCFTRGQSERGTSQGALYLTNIQQLYQAPQVLAEPDPIGDVMGSLPPTKKAESDDFARRIAARKAPLVVLNDEAHHTHDEGSEWNATIRRIHTALRDARTPPQVLGAPEDDAPEPQVLAVASQLDFSATPRFNKGALFTWTVFDYPLKQAILDGIVKMPIKGVMPGTQDGKSTIASTRYKVYLTAAVERWKEYREQLAPLDKKPLLFVMMNDTAEADDVGKWLQDRYPSEFGGEGLLVIHTDRAGEVSKKDLEVARGLARSVDQAESKINCIVSVLMLREGWDVQNVCVVLGLRPFSAKSNILPEQAIGRGLRLMFRGPGSQASGVAGTHGGYRERVDVIGNKAFIEFVEDLEREEDIELKSFEVGKDRLSILTIRAEESKLDMDIAVPELSPILARKTSLAEEIAALDVMAFSCPILPRKSTDAAAAEFRYEGYDFLSLQKEVERLYTIPEAQTSEEVVGYYARRIATAVKLPSQFAALAPRVREFLHLKAFGEEIDLDAPGMVRVISHNNVQYVTEREFTKALRANVIEERVPELLEEGRKISATPPFPWGRAICEASKCVFNVVPCDNEFERAFAKFLQSAPDVERFTKLPEQFAFAIQYTDSVASLRHYEPDFVALCGGVLYLIETKGREDLDVAHKDRAAALWCQNASALTSQNWRYLKVRQDDWNKLGPDDFCDLLVLCPPTKAD